MITAAALVPAEVRAQTDSDGLWDDSSSLEIGRDTMQASTTRLDFGKFLVNGSYSLVAPVPGSLAVVGMNSSMNLVRYDLDTNELIESDRFFDEGTPAQIIVSPSGDWVYALIEYGVTGSTVWQYGASDLRFEQRFSFTRDGAVAISAVPGDDDAVVLSTRSQITLFRDGIPGTDRVLRAENDLGEAVVFDDDRGFVPGADGLYEFAVGATGVTDFGQVIPGASTGPLVPRDITRFEWNGQTYELPGLSPRTTTVFDQALADPTAPYRYDNVVFSEVTGEPIEPEYFCDRLGPAQAAIGDGWIVDDGFTFTNLLDRCGAYGEFTPVDPARVYDTRSGNGFPGAGQPLRADQTRRVLIHGLGGVPVEGVESVVLNVTAVRQRDAGGGQNFLTVWPSGFDQPTVSNLNVRDGETVGNMVTVSTAAGGYVDVYSALGTVDLTVDVLGYFAGAEAPGGARFTSVGPTRLLDTRSTFRRIGASESVEVDISSVIGGFAAREAVAVVVNVTAVQPTERSFFRIYPSGAGLPDASAMNFDPGTNTNRLVTAAVTDGRFTLRNELGSTDVTVDLVGVYSTLDGSGGTFQDGRFLGLVPYRAADTRIDSPFDGDGRIPGSFVLFLEGYRSEITLAANLTAIRPTDIGFMSTGKWTNNDIDGDFRALEATSSLNYSPGRIVSNHTLVTASSGNGGVAVYNSVGLTHFALDVFGYYTKG